ncbi:MAG: hypothetical protein M3433_01185 [Actinomycetota bacterium]|nr:hypothetical protein [Actinomycetota bacterium]
MAEHDLDTDQVAQAIDQLGEAEKLIVTLVLYESRSMDEAAEVLELSTEDAAALYERAVLRIRERVGRTADARPILSQATIDAECAAAWRAYDAGLAERYTEYFEHRPELRGEQRYSARDLVAALPPGGAGLGDLVAPGEWHRHYLSAKSSQTLAVGLLGRAARLDPSLNWLWQAFGPLPGAASDFPSIEFEQPLDPEVLNERPQQTAVDVLVRDPTALMCIEVKWREEGLGACKRGPDGGNPVQGHCAQRVQDRELYWQAAGDLFGFPERQPPGPCPISAAYQAVRNAAAAQALAEPGQVPVFGLIYDENNPYFAGHGGWPGWPAILSGAVEANADEQQFRFRSISWQALFPLLPLDEETREWAHEKHQLV